MFDQLDIVEERYEQLNELLSDPDVVNDADKLRKYSKNKLTYKRLLMCTEVIKPKRRITRY